MIFNNTDKYKYNIILFQIQFKYKYHKIFLQKNIYTIFKQFSRKIVITVINDIIINIKEIIIIIINSYFIFNYIAIIFFI